MPRIQTIKSKKFPEGWEIIEPTLTELANQMKDAENMPFEGKRKAEMLWPIYKINHQRSRYIYELFYKKKEISRELYDYCLKENYADKNLLAKWKKSGYEKLCCVQCINTKNTAFGGTCVCRVPKSKLEEGRSVKCQACGCTGCASCD